MPTSRAASRPPAVSLSGASTLRSTNTAERIVEELRGLIATGKISKGARLPTERDLASTYGVSPSTIREAIRALAVMGLVEVRHGSGTYVVEDTSALVRSSLVTAMQMEGVQISEVLRLLALINEQAASLAVERATPENVQALSEANNAVASGSTSREILDGVVSFLTALLACAHEPLLRVFGGFLIQLLDRIESDLFPDDAQFWRTLTGNAYEDRQAIIQAISQKNHDAVVQAVRKYHAGAIDLLETSALETGPGSKLSDERFAALISALITTR